MGTDQIRDGCAFDVRAALQHLAEPNYKPEHGDYDLPALTSSTEI